MNQVMARNPTTGELVYYPLDLFLFSTDGYIKAYRENFPSGTSFTVIHNLGTEQIAVQVWRTDGVKTLINPHQVTVIDQNTIAVQLTLARQVTIIVAG